MIDVTVKNKYIQNNVYPGAIVCNTPKSAGYCKLVSTTDELLDYFGDPFINPSIYSDLIVTYNLVRQNIPIYISSVKDVKYNDDSFTNIHYNGYTEFYFIEDGFSTVGYKLKSDIKFCQPIIRKIELLETYKQIRLSVGLFYLDSKLKREPSNVNVLYDSRLYRTIYFTFSIDSSTDDDIISSFDNNGLEIKIVNAGNNNKALLNKLVNLGNFSISLSSIDGTLDSDGYIVTPSYKYNTHTSNYAYSIDSDSVEVAYRDAITDLANVNTAPILLCLSRLYKSVNVYDADMLVSSYLEPLDVDMHIEINNIALSLFNDTCDTYLYINMPDVSAVTAIKVLSGTVPYDHTSKLLDQYNADVYFGYTSDFINDSLAQSSVKRVSFPASLLVFYTSMTSSEAYITNGISDLNISNRHLKIGIPESSAIRLLNNRCNSIVTFDKGIPSTYGDRSLSSSPNLQYSHIARNFIRLRRSIKEYLDTKKFIINTLYNIQAIVNTLNMSILGDLKSSGFLSDYSIEYSAQFQTVTLNIRLLFPSITDEINLNFTI